MYLVIGQYAIRITRIGLKDYTFTCLRPDEGSGEYHSQTRFATFKLNYQGMEILKGKLKYL